MYEELKEVTRINGRKEALSSFDAFIQDKLYGKSNIWLRRYDDVLNIGDKIVVAANPNNISYTVKDILHGRNTGYYVNYLCHQDGDSEDDKAGVFIFQDPNPIEWQAMRLSNDPDGIVVRKYKDIDVRGRAEIIKLRENIDYTQGDFIALNNITYIKHDVSNMTRPIYDRTPMTLKEVLKYFIGVLDCMHNYHSYGITGFPIDISEWWLDLNGRVHIIDYKGSLQRPERSNIFMINTYAEVRAVIDALYQVLFESRFKERKVFKWYINWKKCPYRVDLPMKAEIKLGGIFAVALNERSYKYYMDYSADVARDALQEVYDIVESEEYIYGGQ